MTSNQISRILERTKSEYKIPAFLLFFPIISVMFYGTTYFISMLFGRFGFGFTICKLLAFLASVSFLFLGIYMLVLSHKSGKLFFLVSGALLILFFLFRNSLFSFICYSLSIIIVSLCAFLAARGYDDEVEEYGKVALAAAAIVFVLMFVLRGGYRIRLIYFFAFIRTIADFASLVLTLVIVNDSVEQTDGVLLGAENWLYAFSKMTWSERIETVKSTIKQAGASFVGLMHGEKASDDVGKHSDESGSDGGYGGEYMNNTVITSGNDEALPFAESEVVLPDCSESAKQESLGSALDLSDAAYSRGTIDSLLNCGDAILNVATETASVLQDTAESTVNNVEDALLGIMPKKIRDTVYKMEGISPDQPYNQDVQSDFCQYDKDYSAGSPQGARKQYKTVAGPVGIEVDSKQDYSSGVRSYAQIIDRESVGGWKLEAIYKIPVRKTYGCLGIILRKEDELLYFNMMVFSKEA